MKAHDHSIANKFSEISYNEGTHGVAPGYRREVKKAIKKAQRQSIKRDIRKGRHEGW